MSRPTHRAGQSAVRILTAATAIALPAAVAVNTTIPAYAATPAQASVVAGTTLAYGGGTGNANNVSVSVVNGVLTVLDTAPMTAGPGCKIVSTGKAECGTGVSQISMTLGDQSDQARIDVALTGFVSGQDGDDTFFANYTGVGFSRITYDGGAGLFDTMNYSFRPAGVEASLDNVANDSGGGHIDNVQSTVENLVGSRGFDTLIGSSARNVIDGRLGNDAIRGLGGSDKFLTSTTADGADSISGGEGVDTISYQNRGRGVSVKTDNVAEDGEPGELDNVGSDVEHLIGTEFVDTLLGGSSANTFEGRGGGDFIFGNGGPDLIFAGNGEDRVFGGTGNDRLLFNRDGQADVLDCGADSDTVNREALDAIPGCENQV